MFSNIKTVGIFEIENKHIRDVYAKTHQFQIHNRIENIQQGAHTILNLISKIQEQNLYSIACENR